jgi:hypothetical protein
MNLWRLPIIEGSILKYRVPPLWLSRTTFAKAYMGYQPVAIGNSFGEHVRNLGTL